MVDPLLLCNGYQMGGLWCILCSHRVEPVIVLFRMHCAIDCASLMHCVDDPLSIHCIVVVYYTVNNLMRIMCNRYALGVHELCNAVDRGVMQCGSTSYTMY